MLEANPFATLGLHADLVRTVDQLGFTRPTPVQEQAIPLAIEGRDMIASAMTGSGKTAAFLLPILQRLRERPRTSTRATRALIVTPTRELAAQIVEHARELARGTGLRSAAVYGGVGMQPQEDAFRRGTDIIAATPGRLLDHFQYPYADLLEVDMLVLDEADRMLDMGFLPDIRRILRHLPEGDRQTMLFSATMPKAIRTLAKEILRSPATVAIQTRQAPARGITQALYPVPSERKVALLVELIERGDIGNVIAFCRTKHRTNRLAQKLDREGIAVARIHGNRSQSQRSKALAGFKSGRFQVLAATDVLARGIDVEALDHVVNFDVPAAPADYIHRVGRTARAEATGEALTFVAPEEEKDIRATERALGKAIPRRTLEGFDYGARSSESFEVPVRERRQAWQAGKEGGRSRGGGRGGSRGRNGRSDGGRSSDGASTGRRSTRGRSAPARPAKSETARGSSASPGRREPPAESTPKRPSYRGLRGRSGVR